MTWVHEGLRSCRHSGDSRPALSAYLFQGLPDILNPSSLTTYSSPYLDQMGRQHFLPIYVCGMYAYSYVCRDICVCMCRLGVDVWFLPPLVSTLYTEAESLASLTSLASQLAPGIPDPIHPPFNTHLISQLQLQVDTTPTKLFIWVLRVQLHFIHWTISLALKKSLR